MDDEPKVEQLENRIDKLENTIEKMMPSRRDALKMGGAALAGGSLMAGTASAGTNQVGTIGDKDASPPKLVDLHSEDINNADTVTTDTLDSTTVNNSGTVDTDSLDATNISTNNFVSFDPQIDRLEFTLQDDTSTRFRDIGGLGGKAFHLVMIQGEEKFDEHGLILLKSSGVADIATDAFFTILGGNNNNLTGTTGPDGTFNIGRFFNFTFFENRTGETQTMNMMVFGEPENV